ncbi:MAG TPA: DUF2599 domain-containing protein [Stenotrophomonas sp.]|jgi:hypothetical protein
MATILGLSAVSPAQAAGEGVLRQLTDLYSNTAQDCGSPTRPAFLCSGLVLSPTAPPLVSPFYGISAPNQAKGGVSVSYLRKDAKFASLAKGAKTGFIFNPALSNPGDHQGFNVLCAFPIAGATDRRGSSGCGDASQTAAVEQSCDQVGVMTSAQWLAHYRTTGKAGAAQCSFNLRIGSADTARAFNQNLQAIRELGTEALGNANEMIVSPWRIDPARSPSVLALFYTDASGLNASRLSQVQWYQASRWFLPIVGVRLPQHLNQDASFSYDAHQQAIYSEAEPSRCAQYIERAEWVVRYDPGFKRDITTLSVLPTACGRSVRESQTNHFFNEMVARFYSQPQWINNGDNPSSSIPSMRRQLICHLTIARGKDRFNLEPSRPFADQARTNAAGCNNF